jgi:PAS domain S-box-containing protein
VAPGLKEFFKKRPFSTYLLVTLIIVITGVIVGITAFDYLNEKASFEQASNIIRVQTEENIVGALQLTDAALKLYDNTLNRQLKNDFILFTDEYNRSGGDPSTMDLEGIKEYLGPDIDLYVINDSGVIQCSTYAPEIGLDFKTVPYFYDYLSSIRNSSGFFPDRVVRETVSSKLRKFAYMPTPDHRYILELGLTGEILSKERGSFQYKEIIDRISSHNPYLERVRIFNTKGFFISNTTTLPDPLVQDVLGEVIRNRTSMQVTDPDTGNIVKYLFIDLRDPDYGSDPSLIVELTYNQHLLQESLDQLLVSRILIALIALFFCLGAALVLSRFLTKPIGSIVEDVDRIAKGDLDYRIRPTTGIEFDRLTVSINSMVAMLKDMIRKQQEVETVLRLSEERYRHVSELISDYAIGATIGPGGKYSLDWASGAIERICGYTPEELFNEGKYKDLVHPEDRGYVGESVRRLAMNEGFRIEFRIITRSGEVKWINHRARPIWDEKQGKLVGFYSAGQDVTSRKQADEQLKELNERLEERVAARTVQLEAINRELESFSYMVSHDLRAPLRSIDSFSRIIETEYARDIPPEGRNYLNLVTENVSQMKKLIDDLINFSHVNRKLMNTELVYPQDLIRQSLEDLREERKNRDIEIVTGDLPPFVGDPAMMKQVFLNLISNAVKFTRKRDHARIEIGSYSSDRELVYFIRDNGTGFDMHYRQKLFGVFQRLHSAEDYEGTGLGLAIVQRIIHRHGGRVWADSEPGKGATFYFNVKGDYDEI